MATFRLSDKTHVATIVDTDTFLIEDDSDSDYTKYTTGADLLTYFLATGQNALSLNGIEISTAVPPTNGQALVWNEVTNELYYKTVESGGAGFTLNHDEFNHLTYADSGHTGFQPAGSYATTTELTTQSGNLQTNIDGKSATSHTHDSRYYTETEVDTISGSLNTKVDLCYTKTEDDTWRASTTVTEMGYLHGVTSDIQTQIDGKSDSSHTHDGRYYTETELDAGQLDNRYYTETEDDTWRASTTVTEMGYLHGVTSDIQTQFDSMQTISVNAIPDADHSANGPQCNTINAGESVTVIQCVYLHSDGEWHLVDSDAAATSDGMLAIALESKTDGQAMNVALPGSFIRDDSWAWTVGGKVYLSGTIGALTQTVPSGTNDIVRIVGHATHADRLFFNPEQTVVVHK